MAKCSPIGCHCGETHFIPQRYIMVLMAALSIVVMYGHRLNISLIITEMVQQKANKTVSTDCPISNTTGAKKKKIMQTTYEWTEAQQGYILAAFYCGYVPSHFPAGILSDLYGARYILTTSVLLSTFLTGLTPVTVKVGSWWFYAILRIFIGIVQGVMFPPLSSLVGMWIPKDERATMGGLVFAANSFGQVFGPLLTGAVQQLVNSWEMTFYFWALIGIIWYVFAMLYLFSSPESHPFITETEKSYLLSVIIPKDKSLKPNWKLFLLDVPMWACVFGQFGHGYLIFFLSTNMSKYFKDVLHVDIKKNTLASSMPYILQWVSCIACGKLSDWMIKKKGFDTCLMRKIYTTIASVGPSLAILAIPYVGCSDIMVIVMLCVSLTLMGPFYCGLKVNIIDITANYAGLIMAIVNGLGAISGAVNPNVVSVIAPDNTLYQWKIVVWLIFAIATVTNVIYYLFAKATRSKFDFSPEDWEAEKQRQADEKERKKAEKAAKKAEKQAEDKK